MVVSSLHLVNTWPPHERSLSLERSLCHGGAREVHAVSEDRNLCECGCINYSGLRIPFILRDVFSTDWTHFRPPTTGFLTPKKSVKEFDSAGHIMTTRFLSALLS
jgi:hypothetical protein